MQKISSIVSVDAGLAVDICSFIHFTYLSISFIYSAQGIETFRLLCEVMFML